MGPVTGLWTRQPGRWQSTTDCASALRTWQVLRDIGPGSSVCARWGEHDQPVPGLDARVVVGLVVHTLKEAHPGRRPQGGVGGHSNRSRSRHHALLAGVLAGEHLRVLGDEWYSCRQARDDDGEFACGNDAGRVGRATASGTSGCVGGWR